MKRTGNLKHIWTDYGSLLKAFKEVKTGKSHNTYVLEYERNLAYNIETLRRELYNETFVPDEYNTFYVFDPKERLIEAPTLQDRVVQHALLFAIRVPIERRFIDNSFACRIGKGTHLASKTLQSNLVNYRDDGYFLKIDIKKFFYSISYDVLMLQMDRIIKCRPTMELIAKFFKNDTGKGLPLGCVTSQVFANLYLNPIDHFVKRELKFRHYLRYMDDMIILHKDKEALKDALYKIQELITSLKLETNNKTKISKLKEGVDFVGYRTWWNRRLIRKRTLHKIRKLVRKEPDLSRIASFLAHAKDTQSLVYVASKIFEAAPEKNEFISQFIKKHRKY